MPKAGLEPAQISPCAPETHVSTIPPHRRKYLLNFNCTLKYRCGGSAPLSLAHSATERTKTILNRFLTFFTPIVFLPHRRKYLLNFNCTLKHRCGGSAPLSLARSATERTKTILNRFLTFFTPIVFLPHRRKYLLNFNCTLKHRCGGSAPLSLARSATERTKTILNRFLTFLRQ